MNLSNELFKKMLPKNGQVVSPYAIPMKIKNTATWSNPDDQYNITLNLETREIAGEYYDFDETTEQWETTEAMEDDEILKLIDDKLIILC